MAVQHTILGNLTHEGVELAAVTTVSETCQLKVSDVADMSNIVASGNSVTSSTNLGEFRAKSKVTGLTPRTRYFCQMEAGGALSGEISTFWTLPSPNTPCGYPFTHFTCVQSISTGDILQGESDALHLAAQTGFVACGGDWHYEDPTTTNATTRAAQWDDQIYFSSALTTKGELCWRQPWVYMVDDHDGPNGNDGAGTDNTGGVSAMWSAYGNVFPHWPLGRDDTPDLYGLYYAFQIGRVRYIATDLRSYRDTNSDADNPGPTKSMMGSNQRQWFKDQLDVARDNGSVAVMWLNTQVWNAESGEGTLGANNDAWWAFDYERQDIDNHMNDLSGGPRPHVFDLTGDMHAWAYKRSTAFRGTSDAGQRMTSISAASLYAAPGGTRGSDWDEGPNAGDEQFAVVCVRDNPDGVQVFVTVWDECYSGTSEHLVRAEFDLAPIEDVTPSESTFGDATRTLGLVAI